ncbi:MAG: hypothetical protein ACODAQ_04510, partial [Phycisphaeraceae bacterium]
MHARTAVVAIVILLLVALPATQQAADRENREDVSAQTGWTEPVHGIRVCAFAAQDSVPIGEPVHLVVLLQNVSDEAVTLPGVDIASAVVVDRKVEPLGENFEHSHNAVIVQSIPGVDLTDWSPPHHGGLQQLVVLTSLRPGGMHVVSIEVRSPDVAKRLLKMRPSRRGPVVLRAHADLLQPNEPGPRDFEFVFRPGGFAGDEGRHRETDA